MGIFDYLNRNAKIKKTITRDEKIEKASGFPDSADPIAELAKKMHSGTIQMMILRVIDETPKIKSFVMVPNGTNKEMPVYEPGQYAVISFKIGDKYVERPFQIASAPYQVNQSNATMQFILRDASEQMIADFINQNWKIGTIVSLRMPYGDFYYEPLRDRQRITAIVAGNGITSIFALAKEITLSKKDIKMNIIYGASKIENVLFLKEINQLTKENPNVKVVYIFSDEPRPVGVKGTINQEIIKKFSLPDSTYLVSGNNILCERTIRQLMELGVRGKRLKWNLTRIGRPVDNNQEYYITVIQGINKTVIKARNYETIAQALEKNGYRTHLSCMAGKCGFCRSQLIKGNVYVARLNDYRKASDKEEGFIHTCVTFPMSDLVISIPI